MRKGIHPRSRKSNKERAREIGLARALSKMGYCSRSQAAELARTGRVQLNGAVRKDPETPVHLQHDRIAVDGREIGAARKIYLMMNKPRGVITSTSDERRRDTVYDLLAGDLRWIAPVGRLDKASEGLLLLTNDSEWAAQITAPQTHLDKTYHVQVNSIVPASELQRMMSGVRVANGETLRVKSAVVLRAGERNCWLEIELDEGKNRQIRRILEALGIETLRLVRTAIGPLTLSDLAKGASRQITNQEKRAVDDAIRAQHHHGGTSWCG